MIKSSANKSLKRINRIALALLLIVAVSLSFGIPLTGKSMINTANKYMESSDALKYEYTHSLGVDQQMIEQLNEISGFEGFGVVDADSYVLLNGSESVVRVFSYSTTTHKDLTLIEGGFPTNQGETVIDQRLKEYHNISIGDELEIKENTTYHSQRTKVVGIVSSNLYMNLERGYSDLGMGRVEGYAYSLGIETKLDAFTSVRFYDTFTDSIVNRLKSEEKTITTARFNRIASPLLADLKIREFKLNEEIALSNNQFGLIKKELDTIQLGLQDTHSEIESALSEMGNDLGITFGPQSLQTKLDTLIRLIDDKEVNEIPVLQTAVTESQYALSLSQTQMDDLNVQLENNQDASLALEIQDKINNLQLQLDELGSENELLELELMSVIENIDLYRLEFNRINMGIQTYVTNYENYQVKFVAYLKESDASIASFEKQSLALSKERESIEVMETGEATLKYKEEVVVGFSELLQDSQRILNVGRLIPNLLFLVVMLITISIMYTENRNLRTYLSKVWIISSILGYGIGYMVVSRVLFKLYQSMYQTPDLSYTFDFWIFFKPLLIGFVATLLVFFVSKLKTISVKRRKLSPLVLRRKFNLPLMNKLSNLSKLRFRNLLKNKSVVIIACLVSSMLLGLLSASIAYKVELSDVIDNQYSEVLKYDGLINVSDNFDMPLDGFEDSIQIGVSKTLISNLMTTVYTFPSNDSIKNWIKLNDVSSKQSLELIDGFVVITEKLALILNVSIGSPIGITVEGKSVELVVSGISENQLGHAIYMSDITYENSGLAPIEKNGIMFKYDGKIEDIVHSTLSLDGVKSISFKEELVSSYEEMVVNFNLFILIPIVLSIISLMATSISIMLIIKSKRESDLGVLKSYGYSLNSLLKERYLDGLLYNVLGFLLSVGLSLPFYRYLVVTTQVPELIISLDPNFLVLILVNAVGFGLNVLFIAWLNRKLPIDNDE